MSQERSVYYPASEVHSTLLPVTAGCSWGRCAFCAMYESDTYAVLPLQQLEEQLRYGNTYTEWVFLTGADPLTSGFEHICRVLKLVNKYLPYCCSIAAYASIRTIAAYSLEQLKTLHNLGLNLLYIGFESGSDAVLTQMRKGHTVAQALEQAHKLNEAKLPFNCIVMYGVAGKGHCLEHAEQTAALVNQFQSRKIVTMNLTVFNSTPLAIMEREGLFTQATNAERQQELRLLLELLDPPGGALFDSTHATNYVKLLGMLPHEREKLLSQLPEN